MAERPTFSERLASNLFAGLMRLARLLPYPRRIAAAGWMMAHVIGPLAGWRRRIRANLALARPDLPADEVHRLIRAVPDNAGRSLAETYSGEEFIVHIRDHASLEGPGLPVLEQAAKSGSPAVLACAHFGNYDAMRVALAIRDWPVGALYRPMSNPAFNEHYVAAINALSQPLFPRSRAGMAGMLRFLKGGGLLALGFDQHVYDAPELRFFGLPSRTALTPAELALKYDAPLIPMAGIRQPDGLSFRIHVGQPIPPGTPEAMMQALNDDLEQLVRRHMDQWLWVHRRWK